MKTSIIIPTYNGANKILNTLRAIEKQTVKDFEIIIVIDGSTDNTKEIVENNSFHFEKLRIVYQENKGRAAVRNKGANEATGDLLIFFDDDTRPIPDCVEKHIYHHQNTGTIAVGNVPEDIEKMKTDFQRYKAYLSQKWTLPWKGGSHLIDPEKPFITAANFSISKEVFKIIGGFDEKLNDAEDFDLAVRASKARIPVYFLYEAIAWHDDFITCQTFIKRQRQYKKAHEMLKRLKPELYNQFTHYEYAKIGFTKTLIYSFFASSLWVKLIDKTKIISFFPEKVKYKLYDIITTGLSAYFPDRRI